MGGKLSSASKQPIHSHIKELRNRLFLVAVVFVAASSAAYLAKDVILQVLLEPLGQQPLTYLTPGGGFSFIFKITMWCGLAVTFPFVVFSLYRFVMPALPSKAKGKTLKVLVASILLFVCGAVFGYLYAVPGALRFLTTFAEQYVMASITADSYLNFMLAYTVGLGVLFQIPLLLVITNWATPLKPSKLFSFEKYVIVLSFVAAAIVTPTPDVVNQAIIALPIIVMYQVGVFAVMWSNRSAKTKKKSASTIAAQPVSAKNITQTARVGHTVKAQLSPAITPAVSKPSQAIDGFRQPRPSVLRRADRPAPVTTVLPARPVGAVRVPPRRSIDGVSLVARPQN